MAVPLLFSPSPFPGEGWFYRYPELAVATPLILLTGGWQLGESGATDGRSTVAKA